MDCCKGLHKILEEISNGIKSELSKLPEVEQQTVGSKISHYPYLKFHRYQN